MQFLDKFSAAVRRARDERHISQRELAGRLNMSVRTIINLENGHSSPRAETAVLIASELDISIDSLMLSEGIQSDGVSASVLAFFSGKTPEESIRFIELCRQAEAIRK